MNHATRRHYPTPRTTFLTSCGMLVTTNAIPTLFAALERNLGIPPQPGPTPTSVAPPTRSRLGEDFWRRALPAIVHYTASATCCVARGMLLSVAVPVAKATAEHVIVLCA